MAVIFVIMLLLYVAQRNENSSSACSHKQKKNKKGSLATKQTQFLTLRGYWIIIYSWQQLSAKNQSANLKTAKNFYQKFEFPVGKALNYLIIFLYSTTIIYLFTFFFIAFNVYLIYARL